MIFLPIRRSPTTLGMLLGGSQGRLADIFLFSSYIRHLPKLLAQCLFNIWPVDLSRTSFSLLLTTWLDLLILLLSFSITLVIIYIFIQRCIWFFNYISFGNGYKQTGLLDIANSLLTHWDIWYFHRAINWRKLFNFRLKMISQNYFLIFHLTETHICSKRLELHEGFLHSLNNY